MVRMNKSTEPSAERGFPQSRQRVFQKFADQSSEQTIEELLPLRK